MIKAVTKLKPGDKANIAYTPAVALNLDRALTTDLLARLLVLAMPVLVIGMADEVVLMPTAMPPAA